MEGLFFLPGAGGLGFAGKRRRAGIRSRLGGPVGEENDENPQQPEEVSQDPMSLRGVDLREHRQEVILLLLGGWGLDFRLFFLFF